MAASDRFSVLAILFLFFLGQIPNALPQSIIQISPRNHRVSDQDLLYCDSWRFSVETNDAGFWPTIPKRCENYVENYVTGDRYRSDSEFVAGDSLAFVRSLQMNDDGKDAWIFDIDETLLSNLPYYEAHGFGAEVFDETPFDDWVDLAEAPALAASLSLYNELEQLGFKIFLLTGRSEYQRNATEKNLLYSGYKNWERLILRGPSDQHKPAIVYKSEKRSELVNEGYTIHGSSGDQWSDLMGFAVAQRSFKLPNPMYYIA
ncbi:Acid phosphatase 1 [Morus notabilis]|uniref:Acid phosphatase 1 n=1 Tax=Morus notabilis TaxID=981085 RepID=W9S6E0_9ROSA|nr:acid phosphatase 1 [Morus notabilis]EXC28686.1 Acid phosphatase 1 [Morus notabilis]